jgi:hypothetical protein
VGQQFEENTVHLSDSERHVHRKLIEVRRSRRCCSGCSVSKGDHLARWLIVNPKGVQHFITAPGDVPRLIYPILQLALQLRLPA